MVITPKVRESRCVTCGGSFPRDSRLVSFAVESFNGSAMLGGYSDDFGGLERGLFNHRALSGLEAGKDATRWYNPPLNKCCFSHSRSLALNAKYDISSFPVAFYRHCFDLTVSRLQIITLLFDSPASHCSSPMSTQSIKCATLAMVSTHQPASELQSISTSIFNTPSIPLLETFQR